MTPERFKHLRNLFEQALERPQEQRTTFLAAACGEDRELKAEVQRMLTADAQSESPIDLPAPLALKPLFAPNLPNLEGREIGTYLIQQLLGSGGMGVVYRATRIDKAFSRVVAFKVVRRSAESPEFLWRFQQEREILASLDHPHIARLIDGGNTPEGLPYCVMEYVEGKPLLRYCDEQKLNVTERLKLFQVVCEAMQYAHQKLVVHRDLKPANILVTKEGVVKLLDFGIAKLLRSSKDGITTQETKKGLLVMTPEFASPEQVQGGPITTTTDVYSLGVVLYELLTGHPPYCLKNRALHEIAKVICEAEPMRPSSMVSQIGEVSENDHGPMTLTPEQVSEVREGKPERLKRRLEGDLDHILLHALRKEPQRRYSSIEQFNEDIRRHLQGHPVLAQSNTLYYRTVKFVRRHQGGVLVATSVFLLLVSAIVVTTWEAKVASFERQRADWRTQQIRTLALSMLNQLDDEVKRLPGNALARSILIREASGALRSSGNDHSALERRRGMARYLPWSRYTGPDNGFVGQLPAGWFADGLQPTLFKMGIDRTVSHSGSASGYMESISPKGGWATLMQQIRAESYRGRRIRLSGFVRSNVWATAQLWMRVDAAGQVRAFDNMRDRPIKGATDWRKYAVVLDVPEDGSYIAFGLILSGPRAKAWVDDLELEIVNTQTPTTGIRVSQTNVFNEPPDYTRFTTRPINLGFEF